MASLYEIGQMMEGVLNATNRACNDLTIKIRFCDKSINEIKGTIGGNVYCANAINDLNLGKQQMQRALESLCSMREIVIGWIIAEGIDVTQSVQFLVPDVTMTQEEKRTTDKILDARFHRIRGGHSIEEDLKAVNPNYVTDDYQWTHNCHRCCIAYEARRRGYDVQATGKINNTYSNVRGLISVFEDIDLYEHLLDCSADSGTQAKINLENKVKNWDDNARGFVLVRWADKPGGHIFMVEKSNGIIRYISPQNGEADVSDSFEHALGDPLFCFRTDNLEFTDKIFDCVIGV